MTYEYNTVNEAIEMGIKPALQPYAEEFDLAAIADTEVSPTERGTYRVSDGEGFWAAVRDAWTGVE